MKKHFFMLLSVSFFNMLGMAIIPDNYNQRNREKFLAYRNQREQLHKQRIQRNDAVKYLQKRERACLSQRRIPLPFCAHHY